MEFAMKKLILITALGLSLGITSAFAHEEENGYDQRSQYMPARHNRAGSEINHINRMLAHVQGQMARYGANWRIRREVRHISGEVNRVNWEYQNGRFNCYHMRDQIDHIHTEIKTLDFLLLFCPYESY